MPAGEIDSVAARTADRAAGIERCLDRQVGRGVSDMGLLCDVRPAPPGVSRAGLSITVSVGPESH
ncbi:hypothetical protein Skr01_36870 [Sphaerisporangium krabiense]|nr:hypothetical protein Skr01_36870 [Sphaerisporangium krabiense]